MKKSIFYILMLLLCGTLAHATTYTWNGATTAWNTTTNWTPNGIPGTGDVVIINTSSAFNPTLSGNVTLNGISMSGNTLNLNGNTLTLNSGNSTFSGGTITNGASLVLRGSTITFSGGTMDVIVDAIVSGIIFNGSTFNYYGYFETTSIVPGTSTGGCTFNDSTYFYHSSTGSGLWRLNNGTGNTFYGPVKFRNNSTAEISMSGAGINVFYADITIENSGNGGIYFGNDTLANGYTISVGPNGYTDGEFRASGFYQAGNASSISLTFTGTSLPTLTGATFNATLNFTANVFLFKECTFNGVSTFTATGSGSSSWYGGNLFYANTTITNNASGGALRIDNDTANTFYANATLNGTRELKACFGGGTAFHGNLTAASNVSWTTGSGTARFKGSNNQTISVVNNFAKVAIYKPAGHVTLSGNHTFTDLLTFTKGNFVTSSSNLMTLTNAASVTGASDSSFVEGPVKKIGNSAFVFPVGKGSYYRAVGISAPSVNTESFTGEYFNSGQTQGSATDTSIYNLSTCNYWTLVRNTGSTNVNVNLYWGNAGCTLDDSATVKVANWNGTKWKDLGNGGITGNRFIGHVVNSATVATYGYFTLGYHFHIFSKVTTGTIVNEANNSYYATWGDYDNDNDLDLFHSLFFAAPNNTNGNNFLFQNNCNGNLTKIQNIPGGLVTDGITGEYSNWVDYDNDGNLDLFVGPGIMYQNNGNGSFTKPTNSITTSILHTDFGFADYNNDGFLDAFSPRNGLFTNDGNGDFTIYTGAPFNTYDTLAYASSVTWIDYDNDNDLDIYLTSRGGGKNSYLYRNDGGGTFTSITSLTDLTAAMNSYGCAWADYDNDGDLDVWAASNLTGSGERLIQNNGNGTFTRITTGPIATASFVSQGGASWADYDNDGDVDLFVPTFTKNLLFKNLGGGNFIKDTIEVFESEANVESYGSNWADYDNDGDVDLFVPTGFGNPNDRLYLNNLNPTTGSNRNYIKFSCIGDVSNHFGVGTKIITKATINGSSVRQVRIISNSSIRGGEGGGINGSVVHFGVGNASLIDSVIIYWPKSNITQTFTNVASNQHVNVFENINTLFPVTPCIPDVPIPNPGYISGQLYKDVNSNCTFDSGTDYPIANKVVQAEGGTYFAFTNDTGYYLLQVPAGNYNVSTNMADDNWDLSSCQIDSLIPVAVVSGDTVYNNDFSQEARIVPCAGAYNLSITSIGMEQGDCPPPLMLQTPCPGFHHEYCFNVQGVLTTSPSAAGTVISITFPFGFEVFGIISTTAPATFSAFGTNTLNVTITNPIPITGSFQVCVDVIVDDPMPTGLPWVTTMDYTNTGTITNLLVDGNFESGLPTFVVNYTPDCTAPAMRGNYCIGNTPATMNPGFIGAPFSGTSFLYADGATIASTPVWCQTVAVSPNTTYTASAGFANLDLITSNLVLARGFISINGPNILITPPLARGGGWNFFAANWCSNLATTAQVCFGSAVGGAMAGNDFGLDSLSLFEAEGPTVSLSELDTCSCDPNDKLVTPVGCGPNGNIGKDEEITYTIRFKNTGSGDAHNIVIRDVIDQDLDINTLSIVGSSHTITNIQIIPDTALIVTLAGIELPADSSGNIIIKIRPKTGLVDGTQITNQAGIYFDNNDVVVTNLTLNTLYDIAEPDASFSSIHNCSDPDIAYDFDYTGATATGSSYSWTFEDGTPSTSTSQTPTDIIFTTPGYKTVTLTVDRNGCSAIVEDSILVRSAYVGEQIRICHNNDTTILIPIDSLASHLSHGDCVDSCQTTLRLAKAVVEESNQPFNLSLVPNPANNECTIRLFDMAQTEDKVSIEIFNYSGIRVRNIYSGKAMIKNRQFRFKTSDIPNGLYFVKTMYGNDIKSVKLIINH